MKSIDDACMSYRHDFGLLDEAKKNRLRFQAKEWLRAFHLEDHAIDVSKVDMGIIENKLWRFLFDANKIIMHGLGEEAGKKWHDEVKAFIQTLPDDDD